MSTAESANENDLSPAQRFNGFLPFSTCNPKNLTPYAKFQRIQASKTQRKEKKHRCRPEIVLAHSGAFSENVRKPVENTRFSIKVGAEILILIVSKSPSLHGGDGGNRTRVRKRVAGAFYGRSFWFKVPAAQRAKARSGRW